jgi:hypothetical protein
MQSKLEQLEHATCNEKNISYTAYRHFIQEKFPHLDQDTEFRKKYPSDEDWATYKVGLFDFNTAMTHLAENKLNLEFNNPDKYHMQLCIETILNSAKKFVYTGLIHGRIALWNDIGLVRISTVSYKGIIFRV